MRVPPKHHVRNSIIVTITVSLPIVLGIGLAAHASVRDLFILVLMTIAIDAVIGGVGGLFFLKYVHSNSKFTYPHLINGSKKVLTQSNVANQMNEIPVEYGLGTEDVLAFYLYHYEYSPRLGYARKLIRRMLLFALAVELIAIVILVTAFATRYMPVVLVLSVLASVALLYYLASPFLLRRSLKAAATQNYSSERNELTGRHKLSITSDDITDITDMGESKTLWSAVEYVAITEKHLFMLVKGGGVYIVPKKAFADEAAFKQFVEAAKTYHQAERDEHRVRNAEKLLF